MGAILLGSIMGCTVVAAALAFLIAAAVYKHHKKKHHSHNRLFNKNHTTDGKLFSISLGLLMEAQLSIMTVYLS